MLEINNINFSLVFFSFVWYTYKVLLTHAKGLRFTEVVGRNWALTMRSIQVCLDRVICHFFEHSVL